MKFSYNDSPLPITYELLNSIPTKRVVKNKVNLAALSWYGFYRNIIFDAYNANPNIADDIQSHKSEFTTNENGNYNNPIFHYSIAGSLTSMQDWQDPAKKTKCYIAYEEHENKNKQIGFIHFYETKLQNKPIVYISQAGVLNRGKGIGRHLMESILAHYPAGTEFYIMTRVFNEAAITLYQKKLGFTPIDIEELKTLDGDERYCGFKHISTIKEIKSIKSRQCLIEQNLNASDKITNTFI